MEFPPTWEVFPLGDFETAGPRDPGELEGLADKTTNSAALRWAVCVAEDNRPALVLQALPCPAHTFVGEADLQRVSSLK